MIPTPRPRASILQRRSWRGFAALVLAAGGLAMIAAVQPPVEDPPPDEQPPIPDVPPPPVSAPSAAEAQPETVVVLRDGQRFTGFLIERTPERIVVRIAGIDTPIKTSVIDRLEILPPVEERYRQMRALIDDTDAERLLLLAEWLRARSQWDAALRELEQVLRVSPDHPEALRLKVLAESQRDLARRPRVQRSSGGEAQQEGAEGSGSFPLMSQKDINIVKVYEVDLKDPPRMVIPRETITQLLERYKGDPRLPRTPEEQAALYRASPTRVLDLMFRLRARELYDQVQVLDQPRAMRQFRDNVHRTWLINSCATTRCHGGEDAGRLRLHTARGNSEATVYTNFIILERYRLGDGRPLINYDEPANSPLLQAGLPREPSTFPHPVVPGTEGRGDLWRPFFRSASDMRFEEAVMWIKAMYRPRPEYPIEYKPPTPEPIVPDENEPPVIR